MKSNVKVLAVVAILGIFAGILSTEAEAGRRCRRSRCCVVSCCPPVCCTTTCCPTKCCEPKCCDTKCCVKENGENGAEGTMRFKIDEENGDAPSCCKPKKDAGSDDAEKKEGEDAGTIK
ncbi:MAG: hypothetical protein R3C12_21320 [Planctomycetaceae bacterium]|nr:hypothetical protein [Planctomycetaceae bacterium]